MIANLTGTKNLSWILTLLRFNSKLERTTGCCNQNMYIHSKYILHQFLTKQVHVSQFFKVPTGNGIPIMVWFPCDAESTIFPDDVICRTGIILCGCSSEGLEKQQPPIAVIHEVGSE